MVNRCSLSALDSGDIFGTVTRVARLDVVLQKIGVAEDGCEGRADFVAHVGQKFALGTIGGDQGV